MPARNGLRRRMEGPSRSSLSSPPCCPSQPATADAPGLPRTFKATTVETPEPHRRRIIRVGSWRAPTSPATASSTFWSPRGRPRRAAACSSSTASSGAHIDTIAPPELNPGDADPVIAFVVRRDDAGSRQLPRWRRSRRRQDLRRGRRSDPPDDIPEIIVGARGKRVNVNATNASIPAVNWRTRRHRARIRHRRQRRAPCSSASTCRQADRAAQAGTRLPRRSSPASWPPRRRCRPAPGLSARTTTPGIGPMPGHAAREPDRRPRRWRRSRTSSSRPATTSRRARSPISSARTPGRHERHLGGGHRLAVPERHHDGSPTPVNCTVGQVVGLPRRGRSPAATRRRSSTPRCTRSQNPLAQTGGQEFGGNLYRVGDINTNVVDDRLRRDPDQRDLRARST